jgi:hypothetical protein
MGPEQLQEIAARDQFWSSLRVLLPEIEQLATGTIEDSPRRQQLIQLLARVVAAELKFRAQRAESE